MFHIFYFWNSVCNIVYHVKFMRYRLYSASAGVLTGMGASMVAEDWPSWGAAICSGALGRPWGIMTGAASAGVLMGIGASMVAKDQPSWGAAIHSGALGRPWGIMAVHSPLAICTMFCNGWLESGELVEAEALRATSLILSWIMGEGWIWLTGNHTTLGWLKMSALEIENVSQVKRLIDTHYRGSLRGLSLGLKEAWLVAAQFSVCMWQKEEPGSWSAPLMSSIWFTDTTRPWAWFSGSGLPPILSFKSVLEILTFLFGGRPLSTLLFWLLMAFLWYWLYYTEYNIVVSLLAFQWLSQYQRTSHCPSISWRYSSRMSLDVSVHFSGALPCW